MIALFCIPHSTLPRVYSSICLDLRCRAEDGKQTNTASPAVKSPAAPGAELSGKQVSVYWPDDKAWYEGMVEKYDAHKKHHFISYEDGDEEWVDLASEKYKMVSPSGIAEARPQAVAAVMAMSKPVCTSSTLQPTNPFQTLSVWPAHACPVYATLTGITEPVIHADNTPPLH